MSSVARWMVKFPTGFLLTPCFFIPSIFITTSQKNNQFDAINSLSSDIIDGIKNTLPFPVTPVATGTHGAFTGAATFTSLL